MIRLIRLYIFRQSLNLRADLEYKVNVIVANLASILGQIVGIAFVWVIFENIGDLGGWTLPQIMLIYGMAALPYGLFEVLFNGLWYLVHHIREGFRDGPVTATSRASRTTRSGWMRSGADPRRSRGPADWAGWCRG